MRAVWIVLFSLAGMASIARGQVQEFDDDRYMSYDSIVEDLSRRANGADSRGSGRMFSKRSRFGSMTGTDPFENVWIHAGVGMVQTTQNLSLPNGSGATMSARGVQATLGIDILNSNIAAEGSIRSFGETDDQASKISLKEFDLKVVFKRRPSTGLTPSQLQLKAAAGLSARYMTVQSGREYFDLTTPASVVSLGGDLFLTDTVSVGLDLSARNAMIAETFDRTSYDGTLRVDTHF